MDGWKLLAGFFALFVVAVLAILAVTGVADASCVSVLSLQGEISFSEPSFFSSVPSARTWISSIEKWDASSSPVLLLEVDSPGGGAVASKELYDALRSVKKPVVAYLGEVAASGGYYAASATQYIVANPNTLTGSLGARAEILNYEQLFQKIGLRSESVQSGRLKDIGAGYRNMTPEERSILQGIIDELKGNFQKDVETARAGKLTPQFQTVLDSRVLSAKQALTAGLIDQVGTRKEALKMAAELGGLADDPAECRLDEPNPFEKAFQSFGSGFARSLLSAAGPTSVRLSYS